MTEVEETANKIIDLMLALPWDQREYVFLAVKHNEIFCPHCGMGDRERPNVNCQCWNDE